jgi:hypothetical protein
MAGLTCWRIRYKERFETFPVILYVPSIYFGYELALLLPEAGLHHQKHGF